MDILERNEIENAVDHLQSIYSNLLTDAVVSELKRKMLESGHESSFLVREIRELWKYDLEKLNSFLEKYGVKGKMDVVEEDLLHSDRITKFDLVRTIPNSVQIEKQFQIQQPLEEFIFDDIKPQFRLIEEPEICELKKATMGMTEEEMIEYLRFHGKSAEQIVTILPLLQKSEIEPEMVVEKPKQLVLKNNKMAAFIDSLTLAFLVGAFSGILFFIVLRLCLDALY